MDRLCSGFCVERSMDPKASKRCRIESWRNGTRQFTSDTKEMDTTRTINSFLLNLKSCKNSKVKICEDYSLLFVCLVPIKNINILN
uniref:Candidate secreted effector n=1 Tax=Meloidogyne incognita TaxID=6306 RepID=A0A914MT38_MELIC